MEKTVKVTNKEIKLKASAFTPFQYKNEFGKDIIVGMQRMNDTHSLDTEFIAEVAYIMNKASVQDEEFPSFQEWLENLEMMDLYELSTPVIELWGSNTKQASKPRKK